MTPHRLLSRLPWTALRAFEAAARLHSFKAAAHELSVSPTAISHQIRHLEARLGVALFERGHRALRLTATGSVLADAAIAAFDGLENALDGLVRRGATCGPGTLTVTAAPSFATLWLAPRLPGFARARPDVELRLLANDAVVDLRTDASVDVALRYGPGPYGDDLHAERLWPAGRIVAVCAPSLAVAGRLRRPHDLARELLLRTVPPASSRATDAGSADLEWRAWFAAAGVATDAGERASRRGPLFSNSQLALEAALAGHGVALVPAVLVQSDLASGRLVAPFEIALADPNAFWLLYRADRDDDARVHAFAQWLRREARAFAI